MSLFRRRGLVSLVCALFVLIPPTVAYATDVQINYAQGVNGVGGAYHTSNPHLRATSVQPGMAPVRKDMDRLVPGHVWQRVLRCSEYK
jgi:hypothetical protein